MTDTPIAERSHSLNDPRYMFAGPQAETSDLLLFNRAREMEKKRLSTYTIFQQTGWLRGVDGKWRFEISDHDAKLKIGIPNEVMDDALNRVYFEGEFTTEPSGLIKASYRKDTPEYLAAFGKTREEAADSLIKHLAKREYNGIRDIQQVIGQPLRLDELLHHPTLFAAYPNLREATILFDLSLPDTVGGEFSWTDGIRLNPNVDQSKILSTIIHEIQHAIQEAEGFAYGGQPEERFTSSIKRHLKNLSDDMQEKVTYWTDANWDLLDEERATADMLTYGMMYQSMRRLREYANRDKPSGVLRLIRNEMGWWHHDKVRNSEHQRRADELERNWYNLPKRHKMQARNRFLREQCAEAADILSDLIPVPIQKQFREDERQLKSILRSLDRAAEKARQALQPLRELKSQSKVAETLKERHHYHSPFKIYQSLAGEIEARNAEARMLLTPEERRETHPEKTADVSQDDAIVIFRNGRGFDVEVPFRTASAAETIQAETPANDRARELVTQYPGQSDAELEAAFEAATSEGDDVLLALILRYRSEKTARDKAGELFSGFADFYTDSDNPLLAAIAEATVRQRDGQDIRATLLERQQGDLTGIQMTNSTGTQGAVFLPDASEPGRVRATFFDQQGFYGHITRDSYEAALEEAWRSGFNRETNGLLETWMNLDSFREGNEVASLIAQVNRGEISHREYLEKAQAIQGERDRANAVVVLRNGNQQSVTVAYRPDTLTPNDYLIPFARTDKALTKEQAQYISDSLMLDWKERPEITVVNRVSELPSALQRDIWKNDAASDVRAAYWKNTVFVIAPRIADRNTLEEVLLHEIVGHYGLRVLLGDHLEPTLERIYQDMGNDAIAEQIKALYFGNPPFDAGNPAHRQLVAEEMMAKLAESGEYRALSEWERFEAQSRNGLRQMGFQLPLNKSDLLNILHGAEQVVRHGGLSRQSDNDWTGDASTSTPRPFDATNPDIRYKRAYHGTPYAFDRFSLEAVGSGEGAQAYGWGLYFASNKKLAEWYRDTLTPAQVTNIISGWDTTGASDTAKGLLRDLPISKAIEYAKARQGKLRGLYDGVDKELAEIESKGKSQVVEGYVYQVDIPEDNQFLIWEKPLTDQSREVIHAIKESGILEKTGNEPWPVSGHMMDGNDLYEAVRQWFVNEDAAWDEIGKTPYDVTNVSQAASEYLNQIGIPGLRYLDAQSRNPDVAPDEADYNYVVWDENVVTIETVNEEIRQAETEARLSRAYHGSPFTFTRFDSQFIGAGEGNQAYGHGLYFAGRQAVAEHYQRNTLPDYWQFSPDNQAWDASGASETARHLLATLPIDKAIAAASVLADQIHSEYAEAANELREIRNRGPIDDSGNLYEVEIPDDHHLMDWDASLKDQPPAIVDALLNIEDTYLQEVLTTDPVPSPDGDYWSFMGETYATAEDALNDHTPEDLIRGRRGRLGDSPKAISDTLNKAGIPGLRYLDAQSRFGTLDSHDLPPEQSHNYVIWDDQVVNIQAIQKQTALPELPTTYKENLIRYSRTPSPQIKSTLPPVRSADDLFRASVSEAKAELAERENQIMAAYEAGHYTKAEVLDAELSELYDELEHRLADLEINGGTLSSKQPVAKDSPLYRILALGQSDDPDSEADLLGILANAYNDYIDPNHWVDRDSTITNARASIENLGGNTDDVSDDAIIDMLKDAYDHYGKQRTSDRKGTLPTFKNRITEHSAIERHPEQAEVLLDKLDDEHLRMLLFEEAGIRASDLNQDNLIRLAMEHRLYEVENKFYNELIRTTINRYEAGTDSLPEAARNLKNVLSKGAFGYDKAAVEGILDASAQMNQRANETAKYPEPAPLSREDKQKQFLYMEIRDYEERLLEAEARRSENEIAAKKEARHCTQTLDQLQTELSMLQAGMTVKEIDQQTSPTVRPASPEHEKPNAMPNGANLKKVLQMSAFQKRKLAEQKSELQEAAPEKKEEPGDGLHP